jgi:hypothetical protein
MNSVVAKLQLHLRSFLISRGILVGRSTKGENLAQLLQKLVPVSTNHKLIRVGGPNDGGYLIPDDLSTIQFCFSAGVGDNTTFESQLFTDFGIKSHLLDFSVFSPKKPFVESFTKLWLSSSSRKENSITLTNWVNKYKKPNSECILKIDIEGAEYESLLVTPAEIISEFAIIVIEFHDTETWSEPSYFKVIEHIFGKLLEYYYVVHLHPNNCCGLTNIDGFFVPRVFELTLHRKDRVSLIKSCDSIRHHLDTPTLSREPELLWEPLEKN